ncbi:solute carrier family 26 member 6-like isoform 2-T2 [Discoglossus pictus]
MPDQNEAMSTMWPPVLSEAELDQVAPRSNSNEHSLLGRVKKRLRCSGPIAKSLLLKFIPILRWLPRYPVKDWLLGDIISGISVGIIQLPQGLAYALLAGVPPVFGLYSSFFPVLLYSVFGTSRHISPGTFAVISVMVGSVTESLVPNDHFVIPGNESLIDEVARDQARVEVASALTFLVGLFQILLGLVQFGFVVTYLSEPLIRGYTSAAAIHVTVSQFKSILGVDISQRSHPLSLIYAILNICSKIPNTNIASLLIGFISIFVLFLVKFLNEKYKAKIRIPIPIELITLIVATGISYGANLNKLFGVAIVGDIPTGMRAPMLPKTHLFAQVIGNAFAIAVVVYAFTISMAKMFAVKHGYNVDSNQAILAAVVFVNLKGIFKQFTDIPMLWKSNRIDLLVWLVTFVATILLNLDLGLAVSVAFSLLTIIFRTQLPHYSILGQVPNTDIYRDVAQHEQAKEVPGVKIFRSSCTLYFANAELYADAVKKMCGIDVDGLIEMKKKAMKKLKQMQEKRTKKEIKLKSKANVEKGNEQNYNTTDISSTQELESQIANSYDVLEETSMDYLRPNKEAVHSLILDFSSVSFMDTVSVKVLKNIFRDFQEIDVAVYLAGCHAPVIQQLETGNFFSKTITKGQLFSSIHDAITYIFRIQSPHTMKGNNIYQSTQF